MALSKERKQDLVAQYEAWLKESNGLILAEYTGLNMPQMDDLRAQARDKGAEFHVIKNRLGKRVFEAAGIEFDFSVSIVERLMGAVGKALDELPE